MDKYEKIAWIWVIAGFLGMFSLGFHGEIKSWEAISLLTFTVVSFGLGLYFMMHDYGKKKRDEAEK